MTDNFADWLASLAGDMGVPGPGLAASAAVLAAIVAVSALAVVLYKEFLQKARLHACLDRISLLRMPANIRDQITHDALIDDILCPNPSLRAQEIAAGSREARTAVPTGNRATISAALVERIRKQGHIDYYPPPELVDKYFRDKRFFNNFYIPFLVSNSGRKMAHISSLVLLARSRKTKEVWAYTAFLTLDPLKILDWNNQTDLSRVSGQFIGASVEPFGSIQLHPWFIPLNNPVGGKKLAEGGMPPGEYEFRITGYGGRQKRLFATGWTHYTLSRELLLDSFGGKDSIGNLVVDGHVEEAVSDL